MASSRPSSTSASAARPSTPAYQSWTMAGTLAGQASITTALPATSSDDCPAGRGAVTAAINASSSGVQVERRPIPADGEPAGVGGRYRPGSEAHRFLRFDEAPRRRAARPGLSGRGRAPSALEPAVAMVRPRRRGCSRRRRRRTSAVGRASGLGHEAGPRRREGLPRTRERRDDGGCVDVAGVPSPGCGRRPGGRDTATRRRSPASSGRSWGPVRPPRPASSTTPFAAASRASARCAAAELVGVGRCWARMAWRSRAVRVRVTQASMSAQEASPLARAASRPVRRIMGAGISTSSPAVRDGPAARRPKIQSLITKPSKPHWSRSTSRRARGSGRTTRR